MEIRATSLLITIFVIYVNCTNHKANIILILTDDQDLVLKGLTPMINTQQLIGNNGATFSNAFVTTPICCPSRSSILTGKYLHNHRTTNNSVSGGCNSAVWQSKHEPRSFVTYLKEAGYKTFYAGKYLNQYGKSSEGGVAHVPPGWDWWMGLVGNSKYYNYTLSVNGTAKKFENDYLTEVIEKYGLEFLCQKDLSQKSFLMVLAPPAPHAPFTPAPKYKNHFKDVTAFRSPNFNVPVNMDKHWLLRMSPNPLPDDFMPDLDKVYRQRWETLLSVDDMVKAITLQLKTLGILDNTFIMFTSDHGYHIGQFGLPWDKRQPYESDLRVPFMVRGPGIAKKQVIHNPVLSIDIAPTVLDIAGLPTPEDMDGESFLPLLTRENPRDEVFDRLFLVEYYGEGDSGSVSQSCPLAQDNTLSECSPDSRCKCQDSRNNTYSCVRHVASTDNFLYCKFQDAEKFVELYDLASDPYQLHNIASFRNGVTLGRYEATLKWVKNCSGQTCKLTNKIR